MPKIAAGGRGVDADRLGPQRHDRLPGRAGGGDHADTDAEGEQHSAVLGQDREHRAMRRPACACRVRRCCVTSGRNAVNTAAARLITAAKPYAAPMFQRETITAATNGPMNRPIRSVPPSVDRAAGPPAERDRLGEVGLAGQAEHRRRQAGDEDRDTQQDERLGEERAEHGQRVEAAGRDQCPLLTDPGRERAGGQVTDELADPGEGDHERGQPDAGAQIARGQRDQRQRSRHGRWRPAASARTRARRGPASPDCPATAVARAAQCSPAGTYPCLIRCAPVDRARSA